MGFFGRGETGSHPVAIIDIGSGSVGGAYSTRRAGKTYLHYSTRSEVLSRGNETLTFAMLRALEEVMNDMIARGAPALRRQTGHARVADVLISVTSPWQETMVRTERVEDKQPFTFTRALMDEVVAKTAQIDTDRISSGEAVIATILNGYETNRPFGKNISMADIIILSSTLPATIAESIRDIVRRSFHTSRVSFTAFSACAYAVFRDVYPHEKDYLIFDIAGEATDIAFVNRGHLMSVLSSPVGVHRIQEAGRGPLSADIETTDEGVHVRRVKQAEGQESNRDEWIASIMDVLRSFSETHALPRKIFLLADDAVREYLRGALDDAKLRTLWLSDEPLTIVPIAPSQFSPFIALGAEATGDVFLSMLALFHGKRIDEVLA